MSGPLNNLLNPLLEPKVLDNSPLATLPTGDRASNLNALVVTDDNTITTARDLGVVDRPIISRDFVGLSDPVDLYKFQLANGSRTQITLDELSGDADIQLIQDANGNGRIETNEILRRSELSATNPDVISLASLAIGEYYIRVQSYQGDTNYRITLEAIATDTGGTIATASELGIVTGRKVLPGTLSNTDNADVYQFQLLAQSDLQIDLTGLTSNVDLYLTQDSNGNGVFDVGETIAQSLLSGNQSERISVNNLAAGRYLVFVGQTPSQLQSTSYNLAITADSAGESFAQASYLGGFFNDTTTIREFVGAQDAIDFYRFRLNTMGDANITLSDLSGDADLVLYQDLNRNGLFDTGERLRGSYTVGRQNENITISGLAAGEYFIGVFSLVGEDTNYRLNLTTTARSQLRSLSGTLGADTFRLEGSATETIISGNGNYAFGQNRFDILDLSNFASQNASFNLLNINGGTGVTLDLGRGASRYDQIRLSNGQTVLFQGIDRIIFSDGKIDLARTPNDPLFNRQWNLHMMGVQNAWRFGTGSDRIVLGIEDSGIGLNNAGMLHPDLRTTGLTVVDRNNISDDYYEYYNGIRQEYNSQSHGTEVQGIIAAASDNNRGIAGINWNSRVIAADVLGGNRGDLTIASATAEMIRSLRTQERLIINLSLEGGFDPNLEALVAAHQDDVLFVIASGNGNQDSLSQPAALAKRYDNVIAVGGVWGELDSRNNRRVPGTRFDYGTMGGSNYGEGLTLMGPTEVLSLNADRPEFADT